MVEYVVNDAREYWNAVLSYYLSVQKICSDAVIEHWGVHQSDRNWLCALCAYRIIDDVVHCFVVPMHDTIVMPRFLRLLITAVVLVFFPPKICFVMGRDLPGFAPVRVTTVLTNLRSFLSKSSNICARFMPIIVILRDAWRAWRTCRQW
jgi:hypothetical protein